jgi:hypothetical protein
MILERTWSTGTVAMVQCAVNVIAKSVARWRSWVGLWSTEFRILDLVLAQGSKQN